MIGKMKHLFIKGELLVNDKIDASGLKKIRLPSIKRLRQKQMNIDPVHFSLSLSFFLIGICTRVLGFC